LNAQVRYFITNVWEQVLYRALHTAPFCITKIQVDVSSPIYARVLLAVLFPLATTYVSSALLTGPSFTAPEFDEAVHQSAPHVIPPPTFWLTESTRTSGPSSSSHAHTSLPYMIARRSGARDTYYAARAVRDGAFSNVRTGYWMCRKKPQHKDRS
jgi:hypothetical protein